MPLKRMFPSPSSLDTSKGYGGKEVLSAAQSMDSELGGLGNTSSNPDKPFSTATGT